MQINTRKLWFIVNRQRWEDKDEHWYGLPEVAYTDAREAENVRGDDELLVSCAEILTRINAE